MKGETQEAIALFILGFFAALILLILIGSTPREFEREAVKEGHARFYNKEHRNRQWEWLPPCGQEGDLNDSP